MDAITNFIIFGSLVTIWMVFIVPWLNLSWTFGTLTIFAAIAICEYIRSRSSVFRYLRIKGPSPSFFIGNLLDIRKNGSPHKTVHHWARKHGKVYGYYNGGVPVLSICDYKVANKMLNEHSHCFRKALPLSSKRQVSLSNEDSPLLEKRLNVFLHIALAESKRQELVPMLTEAMVSGFRLLKEKADAKRSFDAIRFYKNLLLDVLLQVGLGSHNYEWLKNALSEQTLSADNETTLLHLPDLLPELNVMWRPLARATAKRDSSDLFEEIKSHILSEISKRQGKLYQGRQEEHRTGLIDWLEEIELNDEQYQQLKSALGSELGSGDNIYDENIFFKNRKLFEEEIAILSATFVIQTIALIPKALSIISHTLAQYPAVQKRLQDEVDSIFRSNTMAKESYKTITELSFLRNVINECLRMYPVGECLINRTCIASCGMDQYPIPKGLITQMNIWSWHYDPDIWGPDVGQFIPQRWNNEGCCPAESFRPFGLSTDSVIGEEFSMDIIKIVLAHTLHRFSFETGANNQATLRLRCKTHLEPVGKIYLRTKIRGSKK